MYYKPFWVIANEQPSKGTESDNIKPGSRYLVVAIVNEYEDTNF